MPRLLMFGMTSAGALNRHSRRGSCRDGDGVNNGGGREGTSHLRLQFDDFDMGMMALNARYSTCWVDVRWTMVLMQRRETGV